MAIWGDKGSVTAYENVIAKYKTMRPDVAIKFEVTPFGQYYQQTDTRLAGRQAVNLDGRTFAIPQNTDTLAVF